jgi:L-iditol 2-dehydrogenase
VEETLDLLAGKAIDVDSMVTHRFPIERTWEAFELVAGYRDGVMKAMIDF